MHEPVNLLEACYIAMVDAYTELAQVRPRTASVRAAMERLNNAMTRYKREAVDNASAFAEFVESLELDHEQA